MMVDVLVALQMRFGAKPLCAGGFITDESSRVVSGVLTVFS